MIRSYCQQRVQCDFVTWGDEWKTCHYNVSSSNVMQCDVPGSAVEVITGAAWQHRISPCLDINQNWGIFTLSQVGVDQVFSGDTSSCDFCKHCWTKKKNTLKLLALQCVNVEKKSIKLSCSVAPVNFAFVCSSFFMDVYSKQADAVLRVAMSLLFKFTCHS